MERQNEEYTITDAINGQSSKWYTPKRRKFQYKRKPHCIRNDHSIIFKFRYHPIRKYQKMDKIRVDGSHGLRFSYQHIKDCFTLDSESSHFSNSPVPSAIGVDRPISTSTFTCTTTTTTSITTNFTKSQSITTTGSSTLQLSSPPPAPHTSQLSTAQVSASTSVAESITQTQWTDPLCRIAKSGLNPNKAVFTIENETRKILIVNHNACQLLGYSSKELIGKPFIDLLADKSKTHYCALSEHELNCKDETIILLSGKVIELRTKQNQAVAVSLWIRKIDGNNGPCLAIAEPVERRVCQIFIDRENGQIIDADNECLLLFQYESVNEIIKSHITTLIPAIHLPCKNFDYSKNRKMPKNVRKQKATGKTSDGISFPISLIMTHRNDYRCLYNNASNTISENNTENPLENRVLVGDYLVITIWVYQNLSGLIVIDKFGFIESCNHHFSMLMFGYPQNTILGRNIKELIPFFGKEKQYLNESSINNDDLVASDTLNTAGQYMEEVVRDSDKKKFPKEVENDSHDDDVNDYEDDDDDDDETDEKDEQQHYDVNEDECEEECDYEYEDENEEIDYEESVTETDPFDSVLQQKKDEKHKDTALSLSLWESSSLEYDTPSKSTHESYNNDKMTVIEYESSISSSSHTSSQSLKKPLPPQSLLTKKINMNLTDNNSFNDKSPEQRTFLIKRFTSLTSTPECVRNDKTPTALMEISSAFQYLSPSKPSSSVSCSSIESSHQRITSNDLLTPVNDNTSLADESNMSKDFSSIESHYDLSSFQFTNRQQNERITTMHEEQQKHQQQVITSTPISKNLSNRYKKETPLSPVAPPPSSMSQKSSESDDTSDSVSETAEMYYNKFRISAAKFNNETTKPNQTKPITINQSTDTKRNIKCKKLRITDGKYKGEAFHRDGNIIDILYTVSKQILASGTKVYCVWICRDPDVSTEYARHGFEYGEYDDENQQNLTLTLNSITSNTMEHSLGQAIKNTAAQNSNSRPNSVSIMSEYEDDQIDNGFNEKYTTLKQIGKGAYGYVKMAYRNEDKIYVVVKFILKEKLCSQFMIVSDDDTGKCKEIPMEIHVLRRVKHPNIVQILDVYENEKYFQLVMEKHGDGMDLFEFIDSRPYITEPLSSYIFRQIADAVSYLHSLKILHRDIKDENIIIDNNFHVKLIDFGSAAYMEEGKLFSTFFGTTEYCSPEVLAGNKYAGPELEMWSLGVTLYVLMFAENPFIDIEDTLRGELFLPPHCSQNLENLLHRMLDKDPRTRLTMNELLSHPWITQEVNINEYVFERVITRDSYELNPDKYYPGKYYVPTPQLSTTSPQDSLSLVDDDVDDGSIIDRDTEDIEDINCNSSNLCQDKSFMSKTCQEIDYDAESSDKIDLQFQRQLHTEKMDYKNNFDKSTLVQNSSTDIECINLTDSTILDENNEINSYEMPSTIDSVTVIESGKIVSQPLSLQQLSNPCNILTNKKIINEAIATTTANTTNTITITTTNTTTVTASYPQNIRDCTNTDITNNKTMTCNSCPIYKGHMLNVTKFMNSKHEQSSDITQNITNNTISTNNINCAETNIFSKIDNILTSTFDNNTVTTTITTCNACDTKTNNTLIMTANLNLTEIKPFENCNDEFIADNQAKLNKASINCSYRSGNLIMMKNLSSQKQIKQQQQQQQQHPAYNLSKIVNIHPSMSTASSSLITPSDFLQLSLSSSPSSLMMPSAHHQNAITLNFENYSNLYRNTTNNDDNDDENDDDEENQDDEDKDDININPEVHCASGKVYYHHNYKKEYNNKKKKNKEKSKIATTDKKSFLEIDTINNKLMLSKSESNICDQKFIEPKLAIYDVVSLNDLNTNDPFPNNYKMNDLSKTKILNQISSAGEFNLNQLNSK